MLTRVKKLLAVVIVPLLVLSVGVAQAEEAIVAKVSNIQVTIFELDRETHRILPLNSTFHRGLSPEKTKEVRKKALNNLIEQAYKVQYALTQEISVSSTALEKRLEPIYAKFGTGEDLQAALGKETIAEFRSSVYRMLLAQKAEDSVVNSKAEYTEEELQGFFNKNSSMYQLPKQYRASHILIKVDPTLVGEERERLIAKAHDLANKAKAGEDFFNLAYYNSDEDTKFVGGDIGYFYSGQTVKEFENAIKDLNPGDITGPVETLSGFHIIQLTDVKDARAMTFDEVKEKIQSTIVEKKRNTLYAEWMNDLKSQFKHEIIHPDLK